MVKWEGYELQAHTRGREKTKATSVAARVGPWATKWKASSGVELKRTQVSVGNVYVQNISKGWTQDHSSLLVQLIHKLFSASKHRYGLLSSLV